MRRMGCLLLAALLASTALSASAEDAKPPAQVLLLPVHTRGVDPAVASFVARGLKNGLERGGYAVVADPALQTGTAVPADQEGPVPSLRELWDLVHRRDVDYAVVAVVSARHGKYVVSVTVACRDGSGPWRGEKEAGNAEVEGEAGRVIEKVMGGASTSTSTSTSTGTTTRTGAGAGAGAGAGVSVGSSGLRERVRLALRDEVVLGMDRDHFAGALMGARADYLMGRSLFLGAYVGYANLPGYDDQRAQTALWYLQLEHRNRVSALLGVPLRIGLGYLLRNGAVLRLSAGLALQLTQRLELVGDLIAPSFWVTPDTTLFSMDLAIELGMRF